MIYEIICIIHVSRMAWRSCWSRGGVKCHAKTPARTERSGGQSAQREGSKEEVFNKIRMKNKEWRSGFEERIREISSAASSICIPGKILLLLFENMELC